MSKKSKPKYLITYLCPECKLDFARTEKDKPKCFSCGLSKNMVVLKKEKLTPKVMASRLKFVSDRMVKNLKKAWECMPKKQSEHFDDERTLLEIMAKANKLNQRIKKLKLKKRVK